MTTFGNILRWLERPFQTTVGREREFLVDQANKVRQMLYDLYAKYEMAVDVTECFAVQSFKTCDTCIGITGFTLPPYVEAVEGAYLQTAPINLYSKWREFKTGLKTDRECAVSIYDIPGNYCTERDRGSLFKSILVVPASA